MDNGGPFYIHISYIFYSGELWVVYMSHIYNKHLPWTMVVHLMYTSPTYSTVVSSGWSIFLTFITNTYHGQWWSILRTHLLQILVMSSGWYICLTYITNTYHGQWWSILHTHLLQILVASSEWSTCICLTFITNTYHGQRWSILRTHLLHILQWWALGGLYVSHL